MARLSRAEPKRGRIATATVGRVRVAVVEDDSLLLGLLVERFSSVDGVELVGSFRSCQEFRRRAEALEIDVLVSDVRLPDGTGLELGIVAKRTRPSIAVVLMSAFEVPGLLEQIPADVRSGWAFVAKQSTQALDELLNAIEVARRGGLLLPAGATTGLELLTSREREVLMRLGHGDSNRAIADALMMSVKTVETMLSVIYQKLGIRSDETGQNQRVLAARVAASLA